MLTVANSVIPAEALLRKRGLTTLFRYERIGNSPFSGAAQK